MFTQIYFIGGAPWIYSLAITTTGNELETDNNVAAGQVFTAIKTYLPVSFR